MKENELQTHDFKQLKKDFKDYKKSANSNKSSSNFEREFQLEEKISDLESVITKKSQKIEDLEYESERLAKEFKKKEKELDDLRNQSTTSLTEISKLKSSHSDNIIRRQLEAAQERISQLQSIIKTEKTSKVELESRVRELEGVNEDLRFDRERIEREAKNRKDSDVESVSSFTTNASSVDTFVGLNKRDLKIQLREFKQEIIDLKEMAKSPVVAANKEIIALKNTLQNRESSLKEAEETIFKQKDVIEELERSLNI